MSYFEFTGKTVKEAIQKACEELNADEALLQIEVLEESAKGFLGIVGQKDARVRVRKRDILKEVMEAGGSPGSRASKTFLGGRGHEDRTGEIPTARALATSAEQGEQPPELSAVRNTAETVLKEILAKMYVEADVESQLLNGAVHLDMKGDGSGLLIGRDGKTLDAIQYLVNKIVNKSAVTTEKVNVVVDTENYKLRREEELREEAHRLSARAKKTRKPVASKPLDARWRRIIHLILADDREVETRSYGEDPHRRIIVYPRSGMRNKRRGR